jgi:hypothetical protein
MAMAFNTSFNNISVMSRRSISFLVPGEKTHPPASMNEQLNNLVPSEHFTHISWQEPVDYDEEIMMNMITLVEHPDKGKH